MNMDVCANICLHPGFQFFCICIQKRNCSTMVILCLVFQGPTMLFPTAAAQFYIPITNAQAFQFFHILTITCYFWCEISHCVFFFFFKKHHFIAFYLLYLCTYFWLCRVFTAARGLSLVVASAVWVWGAICRVAGASHRRGLSCCRAQAPGHAGSVAVAPWRRCSMAGNLPGPGMEARSSALSGFLTTDPPGKSPHLVLVFIFLMISNLEQLSCTYWTFVYLVWQNTYSNSLPNFKTSLLLHCWVLGVLYTFWLWISYHIYDLQISSPIP